MTVRVSKPEFNLREKITELDYDRVPIQKMPAGSVVQVKYHFIGATETGGSTHSSNSLYSKEHSSSIVENS